MQEQIAAYLDGKDAIVGVAVVMDGQKIAEHNGDRQFPMLSVYKLPIAFALARQLDKMQVPTDITYLIQPDDLKPNTYSPMVAAVHPGDIITIEQLLAYSLQQSDNNASDILLRLAGGADTVMERLKQSGVAGINIRYSEDDMHTDTTLCYANSSTPGCMTAFLETLYSTEGGEWMQTVKQLIEDCRTGVNRLAAPLADKAVTLGHKTGTGDTLPSGRIMAVNDVGYVTLPSGKHYTIAVFITDSGYPLEATEQIIAQISEIVITGM